MNLYYLLDTQNIEMFADRTVYMAFYQGTLPDRDTFTMAESPRRHRGERTTTIPMKTPPLPVEFAVDGCLILCGGWESVPRAGSKTPPASCGGGAFEMIGGLWSR